MFQIFTFQSSSISKELTIYLPDDYNESKKRYPVMYINDGQNAFFDNLSYSGVSWGFVDYVNKYHLDIIMVAIPCIFDDYGRMTEYGPWVMNKEIAYFYTKKKGVSLGGKGEAYIDWLKDELKPYIDTHYRTIPTDTSMTGSSMSAVITAYASLKYPDIFSKGAALSTAFWFYEEEFKTLIEETNLDKLEIFYFDCGEYEGCGDAYTDKLYITSNTKIYNQLINKTTHIDYHFMKGASHNEYEWRQRVPYFMKLFYGENND